MKLPLLSAIRRLRPSLSIWCPSGSSFSSGHHGRTGANGSSSGPNPMMSVKAALISTTAPSSSSTKNASCSESSRAARQRAWWLRSRASSTLARTRASSSAAENGLTR